MPTIYATSPPSPLPTPTPVPTPIPSLKPCENPDDYRAPPLSLAGIKHMAISGDAQRLYFLTPSADTSVSPRRRQGLLIWEEGQLSHYHVQGQVWSTCDSLTELEKDDRERLYLLRTRTESMNNADYRVQEILRLSPEAITPVVARKDRLTTPAPQPSQLPLAPGLQAMHLPPGADGNFIYYWENLGTYSEPEYKTWMRDLIQQTSHELGRFNQFVVDQNHVMYSGFDKIQPALGPDYRESSILQKQRLVSEIPTDTGFLMQRMSHDAWFIYYLSYSQAASPAIWRLDIAAKTLRPWVNTGNGLGQLDDLVLDRQDNVYVLDSREGSVRQITPQGHVSTLFQKP